MNEGEGNGLAGKIDQLRLLIEATTARSDERHTDICHRLASLDAGLDSVRQAQQHHGLAIASMQAVCSERAKGCGALHDDLRGKQLRQSVELDKIRGGVEEVSQVTALADVRRAQTMRLFRVGWGVTWKVLMVLATLGLLGTGTVGIIKLLR